MIAFRDDVGVELPTIESDFYSSGVDSLKAIQMRRLIQNRLDTGGNTLCSNVVYEHGNARGLAKHLFALSMGHEVQETHDIDLMRQLIHKYSTFQKHEYKHNCIYDRVSRSPRYSVVCQSLPKSIKEKFPDVKKKYLQEQPAP